jgi:hypothetical protein
MLKKEAPTLIELRENAYHLRVKEHGHNYQPVKKAGMVAKKCETTARILASQAK